MLPIEKQKMLQRQSLPLDAKIQMTKQRIKDWINHWDGEVYLSFSGGKDSTVLKRIIESMGYNIPCVFSNTGLEMPEIVKFARAQKNVVEIRPKVDYNTVWKKVGIPIGSKKVSRQIRTLKAGPTGGGHTYKLYDEGITKAGHSAPSWKIAKKWRKFIDSDIKTSEQCCDYLKKEPIATFEKLSGLKGRSFTGMMASEGGYRAEMTQCNTFEGKTTRSSPMLFWSDDDVFAYIEKFNVEICSVYFDRTIKHNGVDVIIPGEKRTGCMFCGFGAHLEKGLNRFQKMSVTHPRQHAIVMDRMGMREAMEMINVKVDYEKET
jgi:3'-phosphoadenosine 5'-phosphosulfate sulfotransferase (PAPS reductase)/FAD synthetase